MEGWERQTQRHLRSPATQGFRPFGCRVRHRLRPGCRWWGPGKFAGGPLRTAACSSTCLCGRQSAEGWCRPAEHDWTTARRPSQRTRSSASPRPSRRSVPRRRIGSGVCSIGGARGPHVRYTQSGGRVPDYDLAADCSSHPDDGYTFAFTLKERKELTGRGELARSLQLAAQDAVTFACLLHGLLDHPHRPLTELRRVSMSRSLLRRWVLRCCHGYILPKNAASTEPRAVHRADVGSGLCRRKSGVTANLTAMPADSGASLWTESAARWLILNTKWTLADFYEHSFGALENRYGCKPIQGSNPCPSATLQNQTR
jgi:hypothetical protein